MFALLGNSEKKAKRDASNDHTIKEARDLFNMGRFPVVTTQVIESRPIAKVLGLVCCRGFDSDEAFFGMAAMAVKKGAQAIIGYNENIAFHPDGSKYFSCFGTAVMFQREGRSDLLTNKKTIKDTLSMIPNAPAPGQTYVPDMSSMDAEEKLTLRAMDTVSVVNGMSNKSFISEEMKSNSAQIAAQLAAEEEMDIEDTTMMQDGLGKMLQQPSEDEDPVLQRLLASQKRQASQTWQ